MGLLWAEVGKLCLRKMDKSETLKSLWIVSDFFIFVFSLKQMSKFCFGTDLYRIVLSLNIQVAIRISEYNMSDWIFILRFGWTISTWPKQKVLNFQTTLGLDLHHFHPQLFHSYEDEDRSEDWGGISKCISKDIWTANSIVSKCLGRLPCICKDSLCFIGYIKIYSYVHLRSVCHLDTRIIPNAISLLLQPKATLLRPHEQTPKVPVQLQPK